MGIQGSSRVEMVDHLEYRSSLRPGIDISRQPPDAAYLHDERVRSGLKLFRTDIFYTRLSPLSLIHMESVVSYLKKFSRLILKCAIKK